VVGQPRADRSDDIYSPLHENRRIAEGITRPLCIVQEYLSALDQVVDAIRGQFGTGAIRRGSLLKPEDQRDDRTAE
jgi:hypothetical protein